MLRSSEKSATIKSVNIVKCKRRRQYFRMFTLDTLHNVSRMLTRYTFYNVFRNVNMTYILQCFQKCQHVYKNISLIYVYTVFKMSAASITFYKVSRMSYINEIHFTLFSKVNLVQIHRRPNLNYYQTVKQTTPMHNEVTSMQTLTFHLKTNWPSKRNVKVNSRTVQMMV